MNKISGVYIVRRHNSKRGDYYKEENVCAFFNKYEAETRRDELDAIKPLEGHPKWYYFIESISVG